MTGTTITARATAAQVSAIKIGADGKPDVSALLEESKPKGLLDRWDLRNLRHAYQERQPTQYCIDKLFALPSLSIVYGSPGGMKSMVMADAAVCVASGQPWLCGLPTEDGQQVQPFNTTQAPILWIDYDNGSRRTDERFDALAKARELPEDAPIRYVSMGEPWLDATQGFMIAELAETIEMLGVKLVIIDNLGLICGNADENSAEMTGPMGNLRRLAEKTGAAVVLIHHQRKGNLADRAGELLRGHSSIEAALDLALLVTRDGQSPNLTITPTKVRGADISKAFGAEFTYMHRQGTNDLETARFWGRSVLSAKQIEKEEIAEAITSALGRMATTGEAANQSNLIAAVRGYIENNSDIKTPGRDKIRGVLDELEMAGHIIADTGERNAKVYRFM